MKTQTPDHALSEQNWLDLFREKITPSTTSAYRWTFISHQLHILYVFIIIRSSTDGQTDEQKRVSSGLIL